MEYPLPAGFRRRAATAEDAPAVTEMLIQCDLTDYGEADTSLEDVLSYWRRDRFVLERDAWLVYTPDGNLAACGIMWDMGTLARVEPTTNVHPAYRGLGLEEYQAEQAEEWTRAHATVKKIQWIVLASQAEDTALLKERGYEVVRHDYVMEIELTEPPPEPVLPDGLDMRPFQREHDERLVHACIQEAFRDVWGHHEDIPFEAWWQGYAEHHDWSPELSCVVLDGDEVAAAAMAFNYDNGGWVRQLGVRRAWRKRGVALAMLHRMFRDFYARGVTKVGLGVDASSPTGATRLYERAGMHIKYEYARYEKEL